MSNYDDRRRDEARKRLAARQGNNPEASRGGRASGRQASLSSLHNVSPQMRERYGMSGQSSRRRSSRYDEWDNYDGVAWDDGRGSAPRDWANPRIDPIGGRYNGPGKGNGNGLVSFFNQFPLPFWIILAVALVLLIAVIVVGVNSCSSSGESSQSEQATQQEQQQGQDQGQQSQGQGTSESTSSSEQSSSSDSQIDRKALVKILGEETADKLISRTTTNEEAKWIAEHPEAYAKEGEVIQRKLLKLAADEPAAISYVRNYPDKYPMATPQNGKINTVATGRGVPRLYQWDQLWGYTSYSGTAFGITGCAPTALSMVYQGLTGSTDLSPFDMAELAERDGFMTADEGTISSFFTDEASALGLSVQNIDVSEKALKTALESGQVVVVNFAPGSVFTETGHYAVITGRTTDDALVLNDPYSEERSNRTWDYATVVEAAMGFYAYG